MNSKKNNDMHPDANQKINTNQNQNQNHNQKSEMNQNFKNHPFTNRIGIGINNNADNSNTKAFNNVLLKSNANNDSSQKMQNESKNKDIIISSLNLQLKNIKQKFKKEIDVLNNQILMIKKQLSDEKLKNQELKKKHETEFSQLSKRKIELSKTLMNNQNELLNLQKEILDKTKEI